MTKMFKQKQQVQNQTIRAKCIKLSDKVLEEIKKKVNGEEKREYEYLASFPGFASEIYRQIFDGNGEVESGDERLKKVSCTVYPPGYKGAINCSPVNDCVAIFVLGRDEVFEVSTKGNIVEQMPKVHREALEQNVKTVYFKEGASYFLDSFPFSLISDYRQLSQVGQKVTLPAFKGGKERTIKLGTSNYVIVFSRLCGDTTIKKIISMLTGREDVQIKISKLLNCKNFDEVIGLLHEKVEEIKRGNEGKGGSKPEEPIAPDLSKEQQEEIKAAFDDIE